MSASITVQYHKSTPRNTLFGYALRVLVTNAVEMSPDVFVFQRGAAPAPAAGEVVQDQFLAIADPVDLDEIPANVPDIANEIPYYRLNEVTLTFRSMTELEETRRMISEDLELLVRSVNAMDDFELTDTVTYD